MSTPLRQNGPPAAPPGAWEIAQARLVLLVARREKVQVVLRPDDSPALRGGRPSPALVRLLALCRPAIVWLARRNSRHDPRNRNQEALTG